MVSVHFYKEPFFGVGISARKRTETQKKDGKKDKIKQNKRLIVNELEGTEEEQRPLPRIRCSLFFGYNCNSIDFPGGKGRIASIVWGETHLL